MASSRPTYQDFRAFLREEGCAPNFDRAFLAYNDATAFDSVMWDAATDKQSLIAVAFVWDKTAEGREFWRNIDLRWWQRYDELHQR
ncbi:MAG: hypothetical protein IJD53_02740 [Alistipes sp.]|nr:hypothetical protein [Alistipes sp.]